MPGQEDMTAAAELATRPEEQQSGLSRRSALRTAAAAGIAATALAATSAPALAAARPTSADGHASHDGDRTGADSAEPIVAHLRNARTGEIDVFRGTSQTRLHDPALAALLIRASR